jgi:hypothetical protein
MSTLTLVTLAERPDLAAGIPAVLGARWPAFMLAGRPGHGIDLTGLLLGAPRHQVLLVDDADRTLAVGLSVPLDWDGTVAGLPAGWDGAVARAGHAPGANPGTVCALSITMAPAAGGRGLAARMIGALKRAAADAGAATLIAPVRPILKTNHPWVPMPEYAGWRTAAGAVFDPWLRLHLRLGARLLGVADPSMTITGSVAEWREWTGRPLTRPGAHVIPGGLVPLLVDRDLSTGVYREPNVWVAHPVSG